MTQSKSLLFLFTIFLLASIYDIASGISCWNIQDPKSDFNAKAVAVAGCDICLKGFEVKEQDFAMLGGEDTFSYTRLECGKGKCDDQHTIKDVSDITCCDTDMCNTGLTCWDNRQTKPTNFSKPVCSACARKDWDDGEKWYTCEYNACLKHTTLQLCCEKEKCNHPDYKDANGAGGVFPEFGVLAFAFGAVVAVGRISL